MSILVLGGAGFVGSLVCEKLVERSGGAGGRIVVPTRHRGRAKHVQMLPTVEVIEADVHDEAQLAQLMARCEAVVSLVGVLHGDNAEFERAHVELPRRLARACGVAGVQRVVHVSALGAEFSAPSMYLRSKAAGEAVLRQSGLAVTVLRPSVVFGAEDRFLNLFARMQAVLPVVPLACAKAQFQPVWVNDVAEAVARTLETPSTAGQVLDCTGPTIYTLAELVCLAGRWSGHQRLVLPVPAALGRLMATLMELLPGEPLISRDNINSMKLPNVASGVRPGLERLGITPASLEAIAPEMLGGHGELARLDRWRVQAHGR